jgi:hypothetical protein
MALPSASRMDLADMAAGTGCSVGLEFLFSSVAAVAPVKSGGEVVKEKSCEEESAMRRRARHRSGFGKAPDDGELLGLEADECPDANLGGVGNPRRRRSGEKSTLDSPGGSWRGS